MKTRFVGGLDLPPRHSQPVSAGRRKVKAPSGFIPPRWLLVGAAAVLLLQLARRARARHSAPAAQDRELEPEDRAPDGTPLEHYAG